MIADAIVPAVDRYRWPIILLAPPALMTVYWAIVDNRSGTLDWIFLLASVSIGLIGIWSSSWLAGARVIAMVIYAPVMAFVLFWWILLAECSTGNCL